MWVSLVLARPAAPLLACLLSSKVPVVATPYCCLLLVCCHASPLFPPSLPPSLPPCLPSGSRPCPDLPTHPRSPHLLPARGLGQWWRRPPHWGPTSAAGPDAAWPAAAPRVTGVSGTLLGCPWPRLAWRSVLSMAAAAAWPWPGVMVQHGMVVGCMRRRNRQEAVSGGGGAAGWEGARHVAGWGAWGPTSRPGGLLQIDTLFHRNHTCVFEHYMVCLLQGAHCRVLMHGCRTLVVSPGPFLAAGLASKKPRLMTGRCFSAVGRAPGMLTAARGMPSSSSGASAAATAGRELLGGCRAATWSARVSKSGGVSAGACNGP
jgi:hypothetical protein